MKENELVFNQPLLQMRVIKTEKDEYDIEVAMYNGPSIGTTEPNEFIAQTITNGLLKAYTEGLKELQEKMLEALSNLSDAKADEASDSSLKVSHTEDNESVDS